MRPRIYPVKPSGKAGLKASPLLLTLFILAISCLISINNCASLRFGDVSRLYSSHPPLPQSSSFSSPHLKSSRNSVALPSQATYLLDEQPASGNGFRQHQTRYSLEEAAPDQTPFELNPNVDDYYNRVLLAETIAAAQPQQQHRQNQLSQDNPLDTLILNDIISSSRSNPASFSSSSYLTSSSSSDYPNANDNDLIDFETSNVAYEPRSGRSSNIVNDDNNQLTFNADLSINSDQNNDNNNDNDKNVDDDDHEVHLASSSSSSSSSIGGSTNEDLADSKKVNRPKPIVSTLVEDEDETSTSVKHSESNDNNGKINNDNKSTHNTNKASQLGKVIERESDRTVSKQAPSWHQFLSRIYESVFGSSPAPTSNAIKVDDNNRGNNEHTKPSEVSSEKSTTTTPANQTNNNKKELTSSGEIKAGPKASSNNNNNTKQQQQQQPEEGNRIVIEESEQHRDKKTKKLVNVEVRHDQTVKDTQATANKSTKSSSEEQGQESSKVAGGETLKASSKDEQQERQINLSRKSTLMVPIDDGDDDGDNDDLVEQFLASQQQRQQLKSTPTLYAHGPVYPSINLANNEIPTTVWSSQPAFINNYAMNQHLLNGAAAAAAADNNNNHQHDNMAAYKSFSRRYHPGQPIFGFTPQVVSSQPSGIAFTRAGHGNDLYFLVMVGAFCVMAVAMVLAAGLFAYRVQQNRKSCTEMDYPTYGVVGPNSVAGGKLGAGGPSFVGGYFANNNQPFGINKGITKGSAATGAELSNQNCNMKNNLCSSSDAGFNSPNDSGIGGSSVGVGGRTNSAKRSPSDNRPPSFMASQQNAARIYHYQHQKQQMISSERNSSGRHTSASDLDSDEENEDGNYTVYECPGLASAHDMEIKNPLFNDDRSP